MSSCSSKSESKSQRCWLKFSWGGSKQSLNVWYEHCQYILIRPVTPVLQTPVPPLQRAADVTPVFNQILMNEQEEEYGGPPQKEIPSLIVWTLGGKNVYVEGSWDNWKSRYNNLIYLYNPV